MSRVLDAERFLSRRPFRIAFEVLVILVFVSFVLLPPINLFLTVLGDWDGVISLIFNDDILKDSVWQGILRSISLSFQVAFIVTIIDVIIGIPIAHVMARYEFKGKSVVDTIIDLPLAVPTSALGFSIWLFWSTKEGLSFLWGSEAGLFDKGPMLLILGHVAFSFSYIVRNLKGVIEEVDVGVETAGRTLGGAPISIFRTITAPMAKEGLIAGAVLAFTRSLGETGASIVLSGVFQTAPVQIVSFMDTFRIAQTAFLSLILIIVSITLLVGIRQYARRVGLPQPQIYPNFERKVSTKGVVRSRNLFSWFFFVFIVLIPSLFVVIFLLLNLNGNAITGDIEGGALYQVFDAPDRKLNQLGLSLIVSIEVALVVTLINIVIGPPMAFLLVKRKYWGKWRVVLDALVDIPLVIPSSALGFSVFLLWGGMGFGVTTPGLAMIVLAHLTFTYPFSVRPMISYIENLDEAYYEAGRTLGGSDITTVRKVILPLLKKGLFSAAILTFTRSMSETGATLIVMGSSRSIPVLIIDLVEQEALPAAAFAATTLILISFMLLLIARYVNRED
ncbi:MAG: iron ABC transporter permease [Candidatus Heimdallarchaeota archaeon]|nr:iron ABC transporter permease [Candidatus Heimdallarchaeota archaeon]